MTMTFKGLAALSQVNIVVEKPVETPKVEAPVPSKPADVVEVYQQAEGKVPEARSQGVNDPRKLRMKPRFVQKGMTPIQMAIHKDEMKKARERLEDKAWKAWAEASLKRHYSSEENHVTVCTAEEALATRTKTYENPVDVK